MGNGKLTVAEDRAHFGLWAITKATLILGSNVAMLSRDQLAIVGNQVHLSLSLSVSAISLSHFSAYLCLCVIRK